METGMEAVIFQLKVIQQASSSYFGGEEELLPKMISKWLMYFLLLCYFLFGHDSCLNHKCCAQFREKYAKPSKVQVPKCLHNIPILYISFFVAISFYASINILLHYFALVRVLLLELLYVFKTHLFIFKTKHFHANPSGNAWVTI